MSEKPIRYVRGIGPKKSELFALAGIQTLDDVLRYYPRDYEDHTCITPIQELEAGQKACICATVGTIPYVRKLRRDLDIAKLRVFDETGTLDIVFYNQRYAALQLHQGNTYLFYGRIAAEGNALCMYRPTIESCEGDKGSIVPIYTVPAGLTQKDMLRAAEAALKEIPADYPDCLPLAVREKYRLPDIRECLAYIHRPANMQEVSYARQRLIFEELFLLSCGLARLRQRRNTVTGVCFTKTALESFWSALGFTPTKAQARAIQDICQDTASGKPMNRLIQGDVGSGKTAVAQALCMLAVQNGYQAAVMAPTEILARQHYEAFRKLFEPLGIQIILLTGSFTEKQKRQAKQQIAQGDAQIIVGTHAMIQQDVSFARLGAAVVDEQHRFGVQQRASLSAKGDCPHILVMSATPIPRTLALILYGDLDVSVIDELPPGRTPVATYAVGENMRERIHRFIEKQCALGGQVYVVCPLVAESEMPLKSAQQHADTLRQVLPNRKIGMLHGRMKAAEKDKIMEQFAAGELDILVSTTVIEVGVNVPNATLMVVEDAQRFGLSQLHQLRGRVGRGTRESYCIFFGADKGDAARMRLKLLCHTSDGFVIAKEDLAQRGPGDFFGKRQHGLPALHIANIAGDMAILQYAQEEATALLARDPMLQSVPLLRQRVEEMFRTDEHGDIFN